MTGPVVDGRAPYVTSWGVEEVVDLVDDGRVVDRTVPMPWFIVTDVIKVGFGGVELANVALGFAGLAATSATIRALAGFCADRGENNKCLCL